MESLSAVSYASTGTCGCWSGTCKPAEVLIFMCFSLPKLCSIFAAGRCNTIVFYSSTSHPPEIPVQRYDSMPESLQRPGAGVRRGHARFAF